MAGKEKKIHHCSVPRRADNPTPWMAVVTQGNGSAAYRKAQQAKLVTKR